MKKIILISMLSAVSIFANEIKGESLFSSEQENKTTTCLDYYKPIAQPNFVHCTNTGLTSDKMEKLKEVKRANALFLAKNKLTNLNNLASLKNVEGELLLNDNDIESLEPLKGLESVKIFDISGNKKITDLSHINNLKIDNGGKFIVDNRIYDKKLNHYSLICEDIRKKTVIFEGDYSNICDELKPL